ncbi:MAG: LptF/LptG family permease [Brucellaceae bacterium]|nr:LptF/LptG family permease [Brucellaceae bacterium]
MTLAGRYVFGKVFWMTVITLAVTTALVMITQVLPLIDMVTRSRDAMASFVSVGLLLMPTMAILVTPFALLLAAFRTLNQMNSDSELVVLEAAGRAPFSTVRPILVLSLLASLATLLALHALEPWATRQFRDTLLSAQTDLIGRAVQSHTFSRIQDNMWIQVSEDLPGGEFGKVLIIDARDPAAELIYYAKRGKLLNHDGTVLLALVDGELHQRSGSDGAVSIITYGSTVLDLAEFAVSGARTGSEPEEMSTLDIVRSIDADGTEEKLAQELRSELHRRNTDWLYPLLFGLIAVFFAGSARTQRQEQPAQIAFGALLAVLLRVGGFLAVSRAGVSPAFAVAAYAVPLAAIGLFLTLTLTGRSLRIPKFIIEFLTLIATMVRAGMRFGRPQAMPPGSAS